MVYSRLLAPRNLTLLSVFAIGTGYFVAKSPLLDGKPATRAAGDYSVTVDRSGGGV